MKSFFWYYNIFSKYFCVKYVELLHRLQMNQGSKTECIHPVLITRGPWVHGSLAPALALALASWPLAQGLLVEGLQEGPEVSRVALEPGSPGQGHHHHLEPEEAEEANPEGLLPQQVLLPPAVLLGGHHHHRHLLPAP